MEVKLHVEKLREMAAVCLSLAALRMMYGSTVTVMHMNSRPHTNCPPISSGPA